MSGGLDKGRFGAINNIDCNTLPTAILICTSRHCDPSHTATTKGGPQCEQRVRRTHIPAFDSSPAFFDGLTVLDPHQSCYGGRFIGEMLLKTAERSVGVLNMNYSATHLCYLR